ncbi:MAG TPA: hypothetical protein EYQ53_00240 [Candidatus Poseidoniales archaeon]|nr:MAG: hypothetical protein CXT69_04290 [Euryarchaeota archaeon]HIG02802.1 hypothetical protein [Candidatus Poseidoniales archaeon]HIK78419.1 hypothetical protein [Candidatus Poseidoniales archaeon]
MRHLRVPSKKTSFFLAELESDNLLFSGAGVVAIDADFRAIPLCETAPTTLPEKYSNYEVVDIEEKLRGPTSYIERLTAYISVDEFEANKHLWPSSHDQMGDLILIKIPDEIKQYSSIIGKALLAQHSRIRMVMQDNGVKGEWRVRDLEKIAIREGKSDTTLIQVKENGNNIWIDPTQVYYSPRLESERQETLNSAILLKEKLGRPLNIIDPYAGVGPGVVCLLSKPGLVDKVHASDLNPATIPLLEKNIAPFKDNLSEVRIDCVDALMIKNAEMLRDKFDLLLVNLPHNTLEHIFHLIPLLSKGASLLKGWAIIHEEDVDIIKENLHTIVIPHKPNLSEIIITPKRTYAPYLVYASIELHFD